MGFPGSESTEDTDLRPGFAVVGITVGIAVVQVVALPHSSEVHWLQFAVKLLLIPAPVAGAFVVGGVRHVPAVWRPPYVGTALFAVYVVSDAVDEVVAQPEVVMLAFEDGMLLVGSVTLAIGAVRWLTHHDARETELCRRNDRLGQFALVVIHDLRSPLNVVQMRLELAHEGHGTEHLSTVADVHDRMETLIQDVLQLARVGEEVGEAEPISLATVAANAMTNTSLGVPGLTVKADARLLADQGRFTVVFESLFRSAVEHGSMGRRESPGETASRGVPTGTPSPAINKSAADVSGRRARTDADGRTPGVNIRIGPLEDGFLVEDDGPGIPPEEQDRIFESGYSTDSRGTGLGLAIVAGVADAHGWEVTAMTGRNGGARFEFRGVSFAAGSEVSTSGPRP